MEPITIRAGEITASCETVEQAAALIRALQAAPTTTAAEPPARRPREAPAAKPGRRPRSERAARTPRAEKSHATERNGRGAVKAKILAFVARKAANVATIARHVYGSDEPKMRARAQSLLFTYIKSGDVKRTDDGMYQVA
jgi:hypothetical protein